MRARYSLLGTILLAGCFTQPAKAPKTPHPQTVVAAGKPIPRARVDSAPRSKTVDGAVSKAPATAPDVSSGDVARRAIDVFGDSLIIAPPPQLESEAEPTWDMDVRSYETQERVAYYVNMFAGRSRDRIADRLEAGSRYEPMIRAKLKAGGLPEDMYYLALVESGFNPHAYSRAAAVGMWQFMTSTARDMGMRVDWWVDERRDPIRSTSAAVRFIRGLRDQFGSLYLAAAAYNGGPGRVSRGLARYADDLENTAGDDAFFVLAEKDYLRNETREYVPQLIAAALIAKEPARYGMTIRTLPPLTYDSVRVPPGTPLAAVAKGAHVPTRAVTELNPQLLRGMTPPRDSWLVRIPTGTAVGFDSSFAALQPEDLKATRRLETKKGDTAERLAREHGIAVSALKSFNPSIHRLKSGRLAPGQILVIPTPAVASATLSVPDPAIEKFPNSNARLKVHTVRRGETMRGIAGRYAMTPERLMRINGLRKQMIFPGQTLLLTANVSRSSRAARARAAAIKAANAEAEGARSSRAEKRETSPTSTSARSRAKGKAASPARSAKGGKASASSSRAKSGSAAKGGVKKRSGADSKADARTKSKTAKGESRAK
ncbi:MAG TPA: transglycosylase SLT domain-containing protein [Gemmatimonadaceae bacterium]|nr:transglycosylase SLT domain-containing protein [Gemmatimonadaceae bacterium]